MVGIVLVSHSWRLAEGAAELAREMGGPDVKLETAGGLDMPDHPIGTDAVLVLDAIDRAWSEDGVVVLMDLGSAVLSAEMALEMLPEDRRERVLLCEAPFVEGAVAAAVTAKLGAPAEQVAAEARGALAAKVAHLGGEGASAAVEESGALAEGETHTLRLTVANQHGLHARPAARFVQVASGYEADVRVSNVSAGRGPVTARSLNAVATLGVGQGDEIEVLAAGPQAEPALAAIRELAERGFDEEPAEEAPMAPEVSPAATSAPGTIAGVPTSPGYALGPARRFHPPTLEAPDRAAEDPEAELRALDAAIAATAADIDAQRAAVAGRAGDHQAAIFDAHRLFLQDEMLIEPVRRSIADGQAAPTAWQAAIETMALEWEGLQDEYQRARAADLRSVGQQVLAHLLGVPPPRPTLEGEGILVAPDLTPADTAGLDPGLTLGIATAFGGPTSHAAILARSLGIPAVVGLGEAVLRVREGTPLALDGDAGVLYVDPPADVAEELEERRAERERAERAARVEARSPAMTVDGVIVEVAANIGSPEEVPAAIEAGCDGVGLFRTEFLFMERGSMPSEDEQEAAYRRAAELLEGRPMVIRTLDVGADKPLPYIAQPAEANPFLGVRGLRLGLERPELLGAQLRAILRVAADHPVRVMFPMVATLDEVRAARSAVLQAARELGREVPDGLEVGIMIEVPAAALTAPSLAPEVDFFSVGTNDLTQYALAADRGNERVAALSDALHPAVLELIAITCRAAAARDRWVGVCGELAADALAAPVLIGLGVRELSMSAPAIPAVKRTIRELRTDTAAELAARALEMPTAEAVRDLLRSELAAG